MRPTRDEPAARLLVVDDEAAVRALFCHVFKVAGFRVVSASCGEEALQLIDSGAQVDLLLLDYRMPGINGGETLRQMRTRGVTAPAVLVSAIHSAAETPAKLGFDAAVEKPCSARDLLQAVRSVLAATAAPQATCAS